MTLGEVLGNCGGQERRSSPTNARGDCRGYGPTGWCRVGKHQRCSHRTGGSTPHGIWTAECYVTMPNGQPGRTDAGAWVLRWPNGRDVAVVRPSHVYRCPCECHLTGQLELFDVAKTANTA